MYVFTYICVCVNIFVSAGRHYPANQAAAAQERPGIYVIFHDVCKYICMYINRYRYRYTDLYIYIYIYIYIYVYINMCVCVCVCVCVL